jgi:hypothetical protein
MTVPMYSMTMVCFSMSLAAYRPRPCKKGASAHGNLLNEASLSFTGL